MKSMSPTAGFPAARWYRSFYFRIGASFVVFVVAVVVAQSAIFSYRVRSGGGLGPRPPNILAAIVAADIGAALAQDSDLDLQRYVAREYGQTQPVALVMKDGTVASNRREPLADGVRRSVDAVLAGKNFGHGGEPRIDGPPVVTAPMQVGGRAARHGGAAAAAAARARWSATSARMLSLPGTLLLIVAHDDRGGRSSSRRRGGGCRRSKRRPSALAPATFGRARRSEGGDEIAHVAGAFNRMAAELAARDEALRDRRSAAAADARRRLARAEDAADGDARLPRNAADDGRRVSTPITRERYLETDRARNAAGSIASSQDLLDLARLENGVGALDAAGVRHRARVRARRRAGTSARRSAAASRCASRWHEAADQIVADPDRIEQVVENLVANALRHTPSGGTIELSARAGRRRGSRCRWPTQARGSRPSTCRTSSIASTRWTRRARAARAAAASGSRSRRRSSSATAARSR